MLTLNVPCISESSIEKKLSQIFIFTLLCGASKGFMRALIFFLRPGLRREGLSKNHQKPFVITRKV